METITDLLNLDTHGDDPSLDILTEMEGNTPIPNIPPSGLLNWEFSFPEILFPADNDGLF